jgi:hypothetical protein
VEKPGVAYRGTDTAVVIQRGLDVMIDVHLPTTDGRQLCLTRYTQPELEFQILIQQLKLQLPLQPPPRITTVAVARAPDLVKTLPSDSLIKSEHTPLKPLNPRKRAKTDSGERPRSHKKPGQRSGRVSWSRGGNIGRSQCGDRCRPTWWKPCYSPVNWLTRAQDNGFCEKSLAA